MDKPTIVARKMTKWTTDLLAVIPQAVIVTDEKLKVIFINTAATTILERPRALTIGSYIWDILPIYKNDSQITAEDFEKALATNTVESLSGVSVLQVGQKLLLVEVTINHLALYDQYVFVIQDDKRIQMIINEEETKQAEIAKDKITAILESIHDAFYAIDNNWNFTYINKQAEPYLRGRGRDYYLGKNIWEEFPELVNSLAYKMYTLASETQETQYFEEHYATPSDSWLKFRVYPSSEGLSVYFEDITKEKLSQIRTSVQYTITKILSESVSVQQAIPLVIGVLGDQLGWDWAAFWRPESNTQFTLTNSWKRDEKKLPPQSLLTKIKIAKVLKKRSSLWVKNNGCIVPIMRGDKTYGIIELISFEQKIKDQLFLPFINAIMTQVSSYFERKFIEQEAKTTQENFRLLVAGAKDYVIIMLDPHGKIMSWNEGGEQMLGYKENEIIGKKFSVLLTKEDRKRKLLSHIIRSAIQTGKNEGENYLVRKDGSKFLASGVTTPLWDDNGNLRGLVKIARDVTERRELEARKDEFISMASHELKTPVTSIKVFTQILKNRLKTYEDQEVVKFLGKMDSQLDKLTKLISELLNLSRIQVGKLAFEWQMVDLDRLVADNIENLQTIDEKHKIILKGSIGQRIKADPDRLSQIIINLITNAIKYSGTSDKIDVILKKEKDMAIVEVRDYGIGIASEHLSKIFDRFYQVNDQSSKIFPGLGIGLYISYEIAKRHGGDIIVKSKKGKGSIFTLRLPI
jgi:PAS domain S-box-containing protein